MEKKKAKVLVIDDDPDMVNTIRMSLEAASHEVVDAMNGKEGIEAVNQQMPDLIILDLIMPEMDGFEVCRTLKNDAKLKHIPIIVLTAIGQEYLHKKYAEEMGCGIPSDCFLTKPIDPDMLLERVEQFIR